MLKLDQTTEKSMTPEKLKIARKKKGIIIKTKYKDLTPKKHSFAFILV
ncbi:hypothetical protein ACIPCA_12550 [Flavobacterium covae]